MPANNIYITAEGIRLPYKGISKKITAEITAEICKLLDLKKVALTVILTTNDAIHEINRDYRSKDRPTDVISFAYREEQFPGSDKSKIEELGDIYLSLEKAFEQSIEYDVTMLEEVKRLLVHSILHLVGYDHETSRKDEALMRRKEDEIMEALG